MFGILRSPVDRRLIDRGMVACPVRGHDVEVGFCADCRWALEMDEQARLPFVRCRPILPARGFEPPRF
ncbi:MAG TPA: hypothetical protein VJM14_00440 [Burkholderiales bacterium]|nr:hypothetical protein [Burkholderiales bacterium]